MGNIPKIFFFYGRKTSELTLPSAILLYIENENTNSKFIHAKIIIKKANKNLCTFRYYLFKKKSLNVSFGGLAAV